MSTILTDDEIQAKGRNGFGIDPILDGNLMKFARAIEAAVLAKLAQRNSRPVAEVIHARVEKMTPDQLAAYESARKRFKLAQQGPLGYLWPTGMHPEFRYTQQMRDGAEGVPVYTHPAPQQADRQRVPNGWKLVPVEPNGAMVDAAIDAGWSRIDIYQAMLAAAPEAPAQACKTDERAEFEHAMKAEPNGFGPDWFETDQHGNYTSEEMELRWLGWQARAALAQKGGE